MHQDLGPSSQWAPGFSGVQASVMEAQMKLYQSVLGGRESGKLEWTARGPTEIIEGRTRVDVRCLQAFQGMGMSVSLSRDWGWRLRSIILFFPRLMIHV